MEGAKLLVPNKGENRMLYRVYFVHWLTYEVKTSKEEPKIESEFTNAVVKFTVLCKALDPECGLLKLHYTDEFKRIWELTTEDTSFYNDLYHFMALHGFCRAYSITDGFGNALTGGWSGYEKSIIDAMSFCFPTPYEESVTWFRHGLKVGVIKDKDMYLYEGIRLLSHEHTMEASREYVLSQISEKRRLTSKASLQLTF